MNIASSLGRADRAIVIGLDCASPELILHRWRDKLPAFAALMERGIYGPLRSCDPPITVPAWRVMASGCDAGQQGVYGFRNRPDSHAYDETRIASSDLFRADAIWDELDRHNLRTTLLGVPGTWPASPIFGKSVTGPLTPERTAWTHPPELADRVLGIAPDYAHDAHDYRNIPTGDLIEAVCAMTEDRFRVARALLDDDDWNLFWMVEIGLDRLHHALWHTIDPTHPQYEPDHPNAGALFAYHQLLDRELAKIVERYDDGHTAFIVVSDHGARPMHGGLCLNVWLQRNGYQTLRAGAPSSSRLDPEWIDWSQTQAWAWGGYVGRIFLNLQGREPQGVVAPSDAEALLAAITRDVEALRGPDDSPLGNRVVRPDRLYAALHGNPPDLLVYPGDLSWRAIDAITPDVLFTRDNDTGPDSANHDYDGVAILAGASIEESGACEGMQLIDVASWLRELLIW